MPSTSAVYDFQLAANSTICAYQGANYITTTYDAAERSYASEVKVLLKCTEAGTISVRSSYTISSSSF